METLLRLEHIDTGSQSGSQWLTGEDREQLRSLVPAVLAAKCSRAGIPLSKPSLMNLTYLLQQAYGVPLGYRFTLYTFGPHCDDVFGHLGFAESRGLVDIEQLGVVDRTETRVYPGPMALEDAIEVGPFSQYAGAVDEVASSYRSLTSLETGLRATVAFLRQAFASSGEHAADGQLASAVRHLKPHLDSSVIMAAIDDM